MLQIYDPYYRQIPNMLSEDTKEKLLEIATAPDAFVDISYKISFFKKIFFYILFLISVLLILSSLSLIHI